VLSFGYPARAGPGGAPTRGVVAPGGPQAARGGRTAPAGALVSATGRYAVQGAQVRAGLELWASRAGTRLVVEDDRSQPARAARLHAELVERGCRFVLGPYGSDSARAVAAARLGAVVWNHGAAADDVQRLPGVVSVPSPASRYLVALGRAVATLRPAATIALVTATGRFAGFAREGLERADPALGLEILACFSFRDPPAAVAAAGADAILACGPVEAEIVLFRALARLAPTRSGAASRPASPPFPPGWAAIRRACSRPCNGTRSPALRRSSGQARRSWWPTPARARSASLTTSPLRPMRPRSSLVAVSSSNRTTHSARLGDSARRRSSAPSSSIPLPACSAATAFRSCAGAERAKNS